MNSVKKVLQFLDGWKLVIGVAVLFGAKIWDGANNGHAGDIVGNFLNVMGWLPGPQSGFTPEGITVAAASGLALAGFIMKLVKAGKQISAGSSVAGALSTEGYIASYVKEQTGEAVPKGSLANKPDSPKQ